MIWPKKCRLPCFGRRNQESLDSRKTYIFGPMPWCRSFCADSCFGDRGGDLQRFCRQPTCWICHSLVKAGQLQGMARPCHILPLPRDRQADRQTGRHTDIPQTSKSFATILVAGGMFQHLQRLQMNLFLRGGWISRDLMPPIFTSWSVWWAGRIGPAHEGPAHETQYVFKQCQRRKAKVSKNAVAMWITW